MTRTIRKRQKFETEEIANESQPDIQEESIGLPKIDEVMRRTMLSMEKAKHPEPPAAT